MGVAVRALCSSPLRRHISTLVLNPSALPGQMLELLAEELPPLTSLNTAIRHDVQQPRFPPNLEALRLPYYAYGGDEELTDGQLHSVRGLRRLKRLMLSQLNDKQLARLTSQRPLPPLEVIGEGLSLTGSNCANFCALAPRLTTLHVGGLYSDPAPRFSLLCQFAALESLSLSGFAYGGSAFVSGVGSCKRLRSLWLSDWETAKDTGEQYNEGMLSHQVTAADLAALLPQLPALISLSVASGEELQSLAWLAEHGRRLQRLFFMASHASCSASELQHCDVPSR